MYEYVGFKGLNNRDPNADKLDSKLEDSTERLMSKYEQEALLDIDRRYLYKDYERK